MVHDADGHHGDYCLLNALWRLVVVLDFPTLLLQRVCGGLI
jgi:hypothetical protein